MTETGIRLVRQGLSSEGRSRHESRPSSGRLQGRHRASIDRDRDGLAMFDSIEQGSRVVAQVARCDVGHATTVAHMRQCERETGLVRTVSVRYAPS